MLAILLCELDGLHGDVHDGGDADNGAIDKGAVLEFNSDGLVLALHQEANAYLVTFFDF